MYDDLTDVIKPNTIQPNTIQYNLTLPNTIHHNTVVVHEPYDPLAEEVGFNFSIFE